MCSIIGRMGWQNPPLPWSELERRLAGRPPPAGRPPGADGGDAPAWSSRRLPYQSPAGGQPPDRPPAGGQPPDRSPADGQLPRGPGGRGRGPGRVVVPYAELHCHSNASFLDGGSHPEELAEEAARLRLEALAITDHDGMYGIVRFAEAARALGLPTVFGAELTLVPSRPGRPGGRGPEGSRRRRVPDPAGRAGGPGTARAGGPGTARAGGPGTARAGGPGTAGTAGAGGPDPAGWSPDSEIARTGSPDPGGEHLVVLARGAEGYGRLCRAISEAQMAGAKGAPVGELGRLAELHRGQGGHGGHWVVLTGCRKGAVPRALQERGPAAAAVELDRL